MSKGTFRSMIEAATKRSQEADANWGRDPETKVGFGGAMRAAKQHEKAASSQYLHKPSSNPLPKVEPPPAPADWGTW